MAESSARPDAPSLAERAQNLNEFLLAQRASATVSAEIGVRVCMALSSGAHPSVAYLGLSPEALLLTRNEAGAIGVTLVSPSTANETSRAGTESADTPGGVQWLSDTPRRIPPEVLAGRPTDGRSLVYAVGVVLYELLSGFPVTESHRGNPYGEWQPLIQWNPLIPEPLLRAVQSALELDPRDRMRSLIELMWQLLPYVPDDSELHELVRERVSSARWSETSEVRSPSLMLRRAPRPREDGALHSAQLVAPVFPRSPAPPSRLQGDGDGSTESSFPPPGADALTDPAPTPLELVPSAPERPAFLAPKPQNPWRVSAIVAGLGLGLGLLLSWLVPP